MIYAYGPAFQLLMFFIPILFNNMLTTSFTFGIISVLEKPKEVNPGERNANGIDANNFMHLFNF